MRSKIFTIDNGDKQFKAKLWLEERNVCFQVLEIKGNIDRSAYIYFSTTFHLGRARIKIPHSDNEDCRFEHLHFGTNSDRDEYYTKACCWLQEFCDINSKVESKFDTYDIKHIHELGYCYARTKTRDCGVFKHGMKQDNFAGIKYEGFDGWYMDRRIIHDGYTWNGLKGKLEESDISMAIPISIRFFSNK